MNVVCVQESQDEDMEKPIGLLFMAASGARQLLTKVRSKSVAAHAIVAALLPRRSRKMCQRRQMTYK